MNDSEKDEEPHQEMMDLASHQIPAHQGNCPDVYKRQMQKYAEDAVREHMSKDLQPAFFREKKGRSYAPFSRDVSVGQVDTMLMRAMHQTDRYRAMKKSGMAEADMRKEFEKPVDMLSLIHI